MDGVVKRCKGVGVEAQQRSREGEAAITDERSTDWAKGIIMDASDWMRSPCATTPRGPGPPCPLGVPCTLLLKCTCPGGPSVARRRPTALSPVHPPTITHSHPHVLRPPNFVHRQARRHRRPWQTTTIGARHPCLILIDCGWGDG